MEIVAFILYGTLFAKAVHVELADERREVGVLKIDREDVAGEFLGIENEEADPILIPI